MSIVKGASAALQGLFRKQGIAVFASTIFARGASLITAVVLSRILDKSEYGLLAICLAIFFILQPAAGMGLQEALLRFGSRLNSVRSKKILYLQYVKEGFLLSIIFLIIYLFVIHFSGLFHSEKQIYYLSLFGLAFPTNYLLYLFANYIRILQSNKYYSYVIFVYQALLLFFSLVLAFLFGPAGVAVAWAVVPILTIIWTWRFRIKKTTCLLFSKLNILVPRGKVYRYGLWTAIGGIASQGSIMLDTLMVGTMLGAEQAAIYRNASILPLSLMFIPSSFLLTEFVYLAKNGNDRVHLINFIKNYWSLFSIISICIFAVLWFFSDLIIYIIFGSAYAESGHILGLLSFLIPLTFLFRIPFGNILSAVGKAHYNVISAFCILILNGVLNYIFITKFGLVGAVYASLISISAGSFLSFLFVLKYLSSLKTKV